MEKIIQKPTNTLFMILMLVAVAFSSCKKDKEDDPIVFQDEDAVEAVESSLITQSNGITATIETAATKMAGDSLYTSTPTLNCGETYADNFNESNSSGNYSYNYSGSRNYKLYCTPNNTPDYVEYHRTLSGVYSTPRMSSDDNAEANWVISNLDTANTTIFFNGSYQRLGTQVSKVRNQNTFTSTINYSLTNIEVDKTTHKILSGNASITLIVTFAGNQYNFSGNITFNGNNTATLVLNGNTYTINL
ncbi:MAG: hypothetical protein ACJ04Q_09165 [Flavobacteriales bacterium]